MVFKAVFNDIDVAVYDTRALKNGNVVDDFFAKLGVNEASLADQQNTRRNVSPGFRYLQALRLANACRLSHGRAHRLMPNSLKADRTPFPDTYNQQILQQVSSGNAFINTEYLAGSAVKLPVLAH